MTEQFIYSSCRELGIIALAHLKGGWQQLGTAEELQWKIQMGAMGIIIYDRGYRFPMGFIDTAAGGDCTFLTLTDNTKPGGIKPSNFFTFEPTTFVSQIKALPIPQNLN